MIKDRTIYGTCYNNLKGFGGFRPSGRYIVGIVLDSSMNVSYLI